ncbi:response regulator [Nocardiopsis terrae]
MKQEPRLRKGSKPLPSGRGDVTKLVLADDEHLVRGAIAALLGLEDDLEVVAEVGRGDQVVDTVVEHGAAVAVLDIEMPGATGLEAAAELRERAPDCGVVILTSFGRPGYLRRALSSGARGFLAKDAPVEQLAGAIRKVHGGGRYIDTELAAAAMVGGESPLTDREAEVLRAAADGATVARIARNLHLTEGTVRNYLSNAIGKTGAENRMAAIRTAQDMGWL